MQCIMPLCRALAAVIPHGHTLLTTEAAAATAAAAAATQLCHCLVVSHVYRPQQPVWQLRQFLLLVYVSAVVGR